MGVSEPTTTDGGTGASARPRWWRRRRLTTILLAGVAVAGLLALPLALLPAYRVHASDAVAWYGAAINQTYPRGTDVTVTLANPFRHDLASAEVVVQSWSDDTGRDLLIRQVPGGHDQGFYSYRDSVSSAGAAMSGNGITAPLPTAVAPSELAWTLTTPVEPSPSARSFHVAGKVLVLEGHGRQTQRVNSFDWRPGSVLQVGQDAWTVRSGETASGRSRRVVLSSDSFHTPLKKLRFFDAGGLGIPSGEEFQEWGIAQRRTVTPAATRPPVYYMDLIVPSDSAGVAGLEVEYWSQLRPREVAFAATLPLARKSAAGGPAPAEVAVPESAWGPKAATPPEPQDLFAVEPSGVRLRRSEYPYWQADVRLRLRHPEGGDVLASYDAVLTGCRDGDGNVLLGSAPFVSGQYEGWGLWQEPHPEAEAAGGAVFTLMSTRMPSPTATTLLLQGRLRVKVGRDPKPAEARNVNLVDGAAFSLGPIRFRYGNELVTRGDLGLLGGVSVLSPEGKLLCTHRPGHPRLYSSDSYVYYLDLDKGDPTAGLTLRGTYLSATRYYTFPFSVTVPLDRQPGRPGATAPAAGE